MIYTVEKATLITEQLRKFTDGYAHHVAGHYSNIDFWLDEVIHALKAIDEYNSRFNKLYNSQEKWIEDHGTVVHEFCPICGGRCEFSNGKPELPMRKAKGEQINAKRELIDSVYYFLLRCHRMGLLNDIELKEKCDMVGTGIDPQDLKK